MLLVLSLLYNKHILLSNILHVPEIAKDWLRVFQLTTHNKVYIEFNANHCLVKDKKKKKKK